MTRGEIAAEKKRIKKMYKTLKNFKKFNEPKERIETLRIAIEVRIERLKRKEQQHEV